jgi:RNA polymerase sigma-70 factor (sigma-E family)
VTDEMVTSGRQLPGRDEAIATLFYRCYPQLVATGYGVAGDWAVAEELAQEAFERLWRRWRWIRDPDAAPAYLHRTVVNLGNSATRRRVLERRVAAFRGGQGLKASPEADMELRQAIAALSPRKRACVVLRYLADMTEAQTAQTLGITPGTVKSQTHKALRQLRQQLAEPAAVAGQACAGEAEGQ